MDHAPVISSPRPFDPHINDDPFTTPTKRPCVHFFDQTPKARTTCTAHDRTPRASTSTSADVTTSGNTPPISGFTLSHLRRVPELALLAGRVVHAETKRRARADREAQKTKANGAQSSKSKPVSHAIKPADAPRLKIKRLFSWAVLKLYEEGSIVLWDGPVRPLPAPVPVLLPLRTDLSTSTSGLWKTANSSLLSSANSTMFSSTSGSSSKFLVPEEDGYLSDPPPHEEEEAYISLTPALLAGPVREVMCTKGLRGGKTVKMGADEITRRLRRGDERWARVGAWAVEEAMEIVLAEWK
jgi:hypothetical protein